MKFQVVAGLESNIAGAIKESVSAEGADLDDTKSLVQLIIERLRPVIFEAVKKALQSESFEIDADDLTIRIIIGKKHAFKNMASLISSNQNFKKASTGSSINIHILLLSHRNYSIC